MPAEPQHLFVYGTLRPGEVRWRHLAQWVVDEGDPDTAKGQLFDTGLDYPAAVFNDAGTIHGRTYELRPDSVTECLAHLDHVEGIVQGLYTRVALTTGRKVRAWAYEYGSGLDLELIPSGDWSRR